MFLFQGMNETLAQTGTACQARFRKHHSDFPKQEKYLLSQPWSQVLRFYKDRHCFTCLSFSENCSLSKRKTHTNVKKLTQKWMCPLFQGWVWGFTSLPGLGVSPSEVVWSFCYPFAQHNPSNTSWQAVVSDFHLRYNLNSAWYPGQWPPGGEIIQIIQIPLILAASRSGVREWTRALPEVISQTNIIKVLDEGWTPFIIHFLCTQCQFCSEEALRVLKE